MAEEIKSYDVRSFKGEGDGVVGIEVAVNGEDELEVVCYFVGKSSRPGEYPLDDVVLLL